MPLQHIRPKTLAEFHGNAGLKAALSSKLDIKDQPKVFLFYGPPGCGKTTLAQIMARAYGCNMDKDYQEFDIGDARGIDDARSIKQNIHYSPMGGPVKVYVLDECFAPGTMIETEYGPMPIQEIRPGIKVRNLTGWGVVEQTFKNKIPLDRIARVKTNSGIITHSSSNHLYMTNDGWKRAVELKNNFIFKRISPIIDKGGIHYATKTNANQVMPWMRTGISNQGPESPLLFPSMCPKEPFQKRSGIIPANKTLYPMWTGFFLYEEVHHEILYPIMLGQMAQCTTWGHGQIQDQGTCRAIQTYPRQMERARPRSISGIPFQNVKKNERKQSISSTRDHRKGQNYQGYQWFTSCLESRTWRERKVDRSTNFIIKVPWLENGSRSITWSQAAGISNLLQSGHRQSFLENSHRSGWELPQLEPHEVFGQEERGQIERVRVDSVEIYKRGSNDRYFQGIIGDTEHAQGFVYLYDLQVSGHPSYYANGHLVHNCHSANSFFQDAMLKVLEEPPKHVMFILCTTEPSKLKATVKRRCHDFQVQSLTNQEMDGFIRMTLEREGLEGYPQDIITEIVNASQGSPGIAMKILDQVIDMGGDQGQIMELVRRTQVAEASVIDLCRSLLAKDWNGCARQLRAMPEKVEVEPVRRAILKYMRKVILGDRPNQQAAAVIMAFEQPWFDGGLDGLVARCCMVMK